MKIFILLSVTLALVGCFHWLEDFFEDHAVYPTYADARAQSIRLPSWLPNAAYDIHEAYEWDMGFYALSFSLPEEQDLSFIKTCRSAESSVPVRIKTKLFPQNVYQAKGIKSCWDFYVFVDVNGLIHAWRK